MYEVLVQTRFSAAHSHGAGVHGHDFEVRIGVCADSLVDDVVVDFHALKLRADELLARIGHGLLNQRSELAVHGCGPAGVARWLFEQLEQCLPQIPGAPDRRLSLVEVWDTETSGARWLAGEA